MKIKIFKQILKEFWLPLVAALLWTIIKFINSDKEGDALSFIEFFGPAFFFVSWLLAQYWRVLKQFNVEQNFGGIETKLTSIANNIQTRTDHLLNYLTGADSYFYYKIKNNIEENWYVIESIYIGDYPTHNPRILFNSKNTKLQDHKIQLKSTQGTNFHYNHIFKI